MLELLEDSLGEARRRPATRARESPREVSLLLRGGLELRLDARHVDLRALEQIELRAAPLGVRQHRLDAAAVLSLEPVVLLEARLDLLQSPGLGLERAGVAAQLGAQVVGLDSQRAQPFGECVELGIRAGDRGREPLRLRERRSGARTLAGLRRDRLRPRSGCRPQTVELAQPAALAAQPLLVVGRRTERLDLVELEREQVAIAIARPRSLAQSVELAPQRPDASMSPSVALPELKVSRATERVEHLQLGR